jgi:hypothetical protein
VATLPADDALGNAGGQARVVGGGLAGQGVE